MLKQFSLRTENSMMYNITKQVREVIKESGVTSGMCVIFCPHTTAGITINENTDPNVVSDMMFAFDKEFPQRSEFRHAEGNSPAHQKSTLTSCSANVIVEDGKPLLGIWQAVFFCEYDGPRTRQYYIKVISD